jgi:hypothetical protein
MLWRRGIDGHNILSGGSKEDGFTLRTEPPRVKVQRQLLQEGRLVLAVPVMQAFTGTAFLCQPQPCVY